MFNNSFLLLPHIVPWRQSGFCQILHSHVCRWKLLVTCCCLFCMGRSYGRWSPSIFSSVSTCSALYTVGFKRRRITLKTTTLETSYNELALFTSVSGECCCWACEDHSWLLVVLFSIDWSFKTDIFLFSGFIYLEWLPQLDWIGK